MIASRRRSLAALGAGLVAGLLLGALGTLLLRDEPGLALEFFPLDVGWGGKPLYTAVGAPRVAAPEDIEGNALPVLFSVRWRGWLHVEREGRYRFGLEADDAGYLEIDGRRVLDATGPRAERQRRTRVRLAPGFHPIEVGLAQGEDEVELAVEWNRRGARPQALPLEALYARRPLAVHRALRRATAPLARPWVRLLGAGLLLAAFLTLASCVRRAAAAFPGAVEAARRAGRAARERLPSWARWGPRRRRAVFFVLLFAVTWAVALPWTVATFAGDDAAYIRASQLGSDSLWYFNRMVHVHLLKIFIALFGGGDSFLGSRVYGAFVFAVTVTALAVAVRRLGPGLQARTLALTLFLLFSQTTVTGGIGAAFTDYTLMMFLTLALAVFLGARAAEGRPSRREWHALALGALTLAACKSKLTGVIVLVLPALLLWAEGRIDPRRFARRMAWFLSGLAAALLALMIADGIWWGDFWWALRPRNLQGVGIFLAQRGGELFRPERGWLDVLWPPGGGIADFGLGSLWILALVTPFVAAVRRLPIERRLLYLLPGAYLLMMIVLYARLQGPVFSSRMLIPILPAACFVGGALFFHLGLERPRWGELLAPRVLAPLGLAAAALGLVAIPYLAGKMAPEELVPAGVAARGGWEPEAFLRANQVPAVVLAALLLAALLVHRRRLRLALALAATFALLGAPFHRSASALAHRTSSQVGELILYPWRAFRPEIEAVRPAKIHASPDVKWRLRMLGTTHPTVAAIFFHRDDLVVTVDRAPPRDAGLALATRDAFAIWVRGDPRLAEGATPDPSGLLVLMRPRGPAVDFR